MEDLSKNGFLKRNPQMSFEPPKEMKQMYKECGSSSGINSSRKPPLPSFRNSSLVDETHVLPINNQNESNEAEATSTNDRLARRLSSMTAQELIEYSQKTGRRKIDPATTDVKKLKRIIANRASAQKYRLKKSQESEEMEKKIRELEETINVTKAQLESVKKTNEVSLTLNLMMKERLDDLSKKSIINKVEIEKNRAEKQRLKNYLQTLGQSAVNAEEENRNPEGMVGHGDMSNQVSNMEDIIHQSTNPSN